MINDGSTDRSGEICEQYSKEDSRFITKHQNNQGVSVAITNGIKAANGTNVCFIDSADRIEFDYIKF